LHHRFGKHEEYRFFLVFPQTGLKKNWVVSMQVFRLEAVFRAEAVSCAIGLRSAGTIRADASGRELAPRTRYD
jgi:hypothetical protein